MVSTEQQLDQMLVSRSRIAKIAKGKKNNLKTPDVPLEDGEVLMLMDSGATIHAGWIKKYFPQYASSVRRSSSKTLVSVRQALEDTSSRTRASVGWEERLMAYRSPSSSIT